MIRLLLVAAGVSLSVQAQAVCISGHPSIPKEFAKATLVLIATPTATKPIIDPEDPEGVSAYSYKIQVQEVLKGKPPSDLAVMSPNTSSRFAMDEGQSYLLFLSPDPDAPPHYYVNNCGNSEEVGRARKALQRVRSLVKK